MARPPIQKARDAATAALISEHQDEWNDLVDAELAKAGWAQEVVEKKVWKQQSAAS